MSYLRLCFWGFGYFWGCASFMMRLCMMLWGLHHEYYVIYRSVGYFHKKALSHASFMDLVLRLDIVSRPGNGGARLDNLRRGHQPSNLHQNYSTNHHHHASSSFPFDQISLFLFGGYLSQSVQARRPALVHLIQLYRLCVFLRFFVHPLSSYQRHLQLFQQWHG